MEKRKYLQGCGRILVPCEWECKMTVLLWNSMASSQKLNMHLPYDPKRMKRDLYISTVMFIIALFTTTQRWKQPIYPSPHENMNKMLYAYTYKHTHRRDYYSAINRMKF